MKLFKLLNQLSISELKQFGYFLDAPFFNKRRDVKALFNHWLKEKKRSHLPEKYWVLIFPEQAFSVSAWNLLTSRLLKLLEAYFVIQELRKDNVQKQFYLAQAYRKRQQEVLLKRALRVAEHALEKQSFRHTIYLQQKYDLSNLQYDYIDGLNRNKRTNLQEVSDNLDTYFLASKLKKACFTLMRESLTKEKYNIALVAEVIHYIDENPSYLNIPAIAVYYYCYQAILPVNDDSALEQFRAIIFKYQKHFPATEIRDIYTFVINLLIRKLNGGAVFLAEEIFKLYVQSLEQGYLMENGVLLESTYGNISSLATLLKKYAWTKKFIETYRPFLNPEFQEPIYRLSLGKLYYAKNEYKKSLQQLILVESKTTHLHLGTRTVQLKIYYETEEFDLLENLLDSLRVYLKRAKGIAYIRTHYNNLLTFSRQLLKLPIMNKKERRDFRQRIVDAEVFAEKDWFLAMINE